jgi:hypothetical protein
MQPLRALRRRVRDLPFGARYPIYRAYYAIATDLPERAVRPFMGLEWLDRLDVDAVKKSDTVFILGGGASINEIDDARWEAIGRHDSVGLNFWFVHPFVPTLYMTKAFDPTGFPAQYREWGQGVMTRFAEEAARRADAYRDVPKIVMHVSPATMRGVRLYPDAFREKLYTCRTISGIAFDEAEFERLLSFWDRRGAFEPQRRIGRLFKYRASVVQLITLAMAMGYRRIVLCGIDLSDSRYFYEDPERYPHMRGFRGSPALPIHITAVRTSFSLDAITVIRALNKILLEPRGIELYVENARSALHPAVPVAPASMFEAPIRAAGR